MMCWLFCFSNNKSIYKFFCLLSIYKYFLLMEKKWSLIQVYLLCRCEKVLWLVWMDLQAFSISSLVQPPISTWKLPLQHSTWNPRLQHSTWNPPLQHSKMFLPCRLQHSKTSWAQTSHRYFPPTTPCVTRHCRRRMTKCPPLQLIFVDFAAKASPTPACSRGTSVSIRGRSPTLAPCVITVRLRTAMLYAIWTIGTRRCPTTSFRGFISIGK